ncbi:MAG: insulinase family protein [Alphaproteobacteria bacterium]|nr:insulinase family protein [Alphaproteobacteria bacterium]
MSNIRTSTLPNGLRIITDNAADMHSVAVGIWTGVGTRHEDMTYNGVAHMVEHMLFKGTKTRDAKQIAEVTESAGINMNAYTSREITSYHMRGLTESLPLMVEVLADMYQHSTLPQEEIERERQVILQEIGMTLDTPDDLVFDNYYATAYPDQALGAPILGTAEIIANMPEAPLRGYIAQFYNPANTVISAAGNVDHDAFVSLCAQHFNALPAGEKVRDIQASYKGGDHRSEKELEQAHFILGFRGIPKLDDDYYAAQALSTVFGGGMSSRLFQEVREKRGLVYSVYSFHWGHHDDGQFGIYAGTGPDKLAEIMPVVCDEVMKLANTLSEQEVARARTQIKSNLLMGRESMMRRADQQASHMLLHNAVFDPDALADKIDALDVTALQNVARRIFQGSPTLAALGPIANLEDYDSIAKRLAA